MVKVTFIVYGPSNSRSIHDRAMRLLEEEGWRTREIKSLIELDDSDTTNAKWLVNAKVNIV